MQIQFSKEGLQNYMVVPWEDKWKDGYQSNLLQHHEVPHFLQYEVRELNGCVSLYYRLKYRTSLKSVIGQLPFSFVRVKNMVADIIGVLETVEEYLLEAEGIVWKTEWVFLEPDTGKLLFCYYPDLAGDTGNMRTFLTEIIQGIDKKQEETLLFAMQFYDLVTEPDCTLDDLQQFRQNKIEEDFYKSDLWEAAPVSSEESNIENMAEAGVMIDKEEKPQPQNNLCTVGKRIVKGLLAVTVFVDFMLLIGLVFNVLTYDSMGYLFGGMGVLILLTIIYMQMSKEDSPDEIMKDYFEEQKTVKKEDDNRFGCEEDWDAPDFKNREVDKTVDYYGETSILTEDNFKSSEEEIVNEKNQGHLYLESLEKEKYPPIHIKNESIVLGCMVDGCNYILPERGISRLHAKIMEKGDGIYLLDLNSTNGTYLNGEILESGQDYKLEEGDHVAFAKSEFYVAVEPV
ncbi:MAG: DUF6382 domain-containing protein [Lachnospiraceae bacterium]